jgi:antitoxin HicB
MEASWQRFRSARSSETIVMRRCSIVLTPEREGGYSVTSPDILDLVTAGDTRQEALETALDRAEALMLTYLGRGREILDECGWAEVATIEVDLDALREQLAAEKAAKAASTA